MPPRPPRLLLLDVNETLSDLAPLGPAFEEAGLPAHDARLWFAEVLRDGFALTSVGENPAFADLATDGLRRRGLDAGAARAVMARFTSLDVHPDVPPALQRMAAGGVRLATLSNGSAAVAEGLLERAGVRDQVDTLLGVEDGPAWKPAAAAYRWALERCGVAPGDAMLVAVHPWDVDGAARAGLRTAWVDRDGGHSASSFPSSFTVPELTVRGLGDLADRLGAGAGR